MKINTLIIVYCLIIVISVVYATQPIQPLLAQNFNINVVQASQFTAVVLFFLALSPIVYGYILEKVCAKKMLLGASIVLFLTNIFLAISNNYYVFLFFRTCEALVIPAILTSLMTMLANTNKENIKQNMSIYVASTVFGGLIGRIISGFIATKFSYEYVFYSLSFGIFLSILLIQKIDYQGQAQVIKPKINDVINILRDKRFLIIYFLMFCIFYSFSGILNVLPFRLKEISQNISEFEISLLYFGYGIGIVVSLISKRIIKLFQGEANSLIIFTLFFAFSLYLLISNNILYLFLLLFPLCIGMFTCHTISTQLANSMISSKKSLTSGMYLTFYYLGGCAGSVFPSFVYQSFGWEIMIYLSLFILFFAEIFILFNRKLFKD